MKFTSFQIETVRGSSAFRASSLPANGAQIRLFILNLPVICLSLASTTSFPYSFPYLFSCLLEKTFPLLFADVSVFRLPLSIFPPFYRLSFSLLFALLSHGLFAAKN